MGVSPAIFESAGQRSEHYVPGVYGRSFNVSSPSGISAGNLCVLGKSNGGEPYKMLEFGSLADAQQVLVGGELLDAVAYAFSGSNTFVPSKVYAMRVNNGTQSSVTLQSGATDLLTLKSWDWGVHTNQLKIMIAAGTVANSKKITLAYKDKTQTIDDIVNAALEVNYLGDGVTPTVSVGTDNISFGAMTDVEAPDEPEPIDTLTVSFADFDTLESLVTYVNEGGVWGLSIVGNNTEMKSVNLDTVTNQAVAETGTILYANFVSFYAAISSMEYIGSVVIDSATTRQVPDNTDGFVYFTGGTVGSYTVTQWQDALKALELEDVQIIATPSTEAAVHTLISAHCTSMSNVMNRKERTCILGGAVGMTDAAAITEAQGLNNRLVSFCCDNPIKVNLISGKTETLTGAMLGVMLAAMESAMSPNNPLTFKQLNVLGFSKIRNITNITSLIKAGIMVCNSNPENLSEYICIRALTTFQGDDLINNERSMVREDLFMNRDLRASFRPVIGSSGISTNAAIRTLKDKAAEWALNGYIVPTDSNENVWDIKVRINGDKVFITYSRYLTAPVNFVFITAINHIYTSTVEL
ncbi:MAG: hypothetical protein J6W16_07245 [Methanobrevibacter sp.]|nr:hypothetical protein [Methanobrevibacter sp.]MBP5785359.1 hypothetical protein [Methanobrevibacter sp.]